MIIILANINYLQSYKISYYGYLLYIKKTFLKFRYLSFKLVLVLKKKQKGSIFSLSYLLSYFHIFIFIPFFGNLYWGKS